MKQRLKYFFIFNVFLRKIEKNTNNFHNKFTIHNNEPQISYVYIYGFMAFHGFIRLVVDFIDFEV